MPRCFSQACATSHTHLEQGERDGANGVDAEVLVVVGDAREYSTDGLLWLWVTTWATRMSERGGAAQFSSAHVHTRHEPSQMAPTAECPQRTTQSTCGAHRGVSDSGWPHRPLKRGRRTHLDTLQSCSMVPPAMKPGLYRMPVPVSLITIFEPFVSLSMRRKKLASKSGGSSEWHKRHKA